MPDKDNNILKYNPREKCMRVSFIIYAHLESLLENISTCHNDPEKLLTTKINRYTPSSNSFFTHCLFYTTKNREPDCYRGKECVENFCKTLQKHAERIIY